MTKNVEELIEELEKYYSPELPDKEISSFELGKLVGHRDVVRYLKKMVEYHNKRPTRFERDYNANSGIQLRPSSVVI